MACSGKAAFPSRRRAEGSLKQFRKRHPRYRGCVYPCQACGLWHFGRTVKEIRRSIRRGEADAALEGPLVCRRPTAEEQERLAREEPQYVRPTKEAP